MLASRFKDATSSVTKVVGRASAVSVVFSGDSARTDGRIVVLPAISDTAVVSDHEAMVMRGFRSHEACHLRFTAMTTRVNASIKSSSRTRPDLFDLINVGEDQRIERLGMLEYDGMRRELDAVSEAGSNTSMDSVDKAAAQFGGSVAEAIRCSEPLSVLNLAASVVGRRRLSLSNGRLDSVADMIPKKIMDAATDYVDAILALPVPKHDDGALDESALREQVMTVIELARKAYDRVKKMSPEAPPPLPQPQQQQSQQGGSPQAGEGQGEGEEAGQGEGEGKGKGKGKGKTDDKEKSDDKDKGKGEGKGGGDDADDADADDQGAGGAENDGDDGQDDDGQGGDDPLGGDDTDDADDADDDASDGQGGGESGDDGDDGDDAAGESSSSGGDGSGGSGGESSGQASDSGGAQGAGGNSGDDSDSTGNFGSSDLTKAGGSGGGGSGGGSPEERAEKLKQAMKAAAIVSAAAAATQAAQEANKRDAPAVSVAEDDGQQQLLDKLGCMRSSGDLVRWQDIRQNRYFEMLALGEDLRDGFTALDSKASASQRMVRRMLEQELHAHQDRQLLSGHTSGLLNSAMLVEAMMGNEAVFRQREDDREMDTLVHIFIDGSGSMRSRAEDAGVLSVLLCRALEKTGAHLQVSVWQNDSPESVQVRGIGRFVSDTARCWVVKGPRERLMSEDVRKRLGSLRHMASGGTPLLPAVRSAVRRMARENYAKKILLVLTDGEPDMYYGYGADAHKIIMKETEAMADRNGIHLIGVGIDIPEYTIKRTFSDTVVTTSGLLGEAALRHVVKYLKKEKRDAFKKAV